MSAPRVRARTFGLVSMVAAMLGAAPAAAIEVVLHDVAPDRVERQRRFVRGELPLPGTPILADLEARLKRSELARGRPVYIRIFKEESELELWMQNEAGTFSLLSTYPICHWTGTLGPKLKEGDRQSPEGFYSVGVRETRLVGRWRKAFNLGFPNPHDQSLSRTGSYILVHGGCSSVGCYAMTDEVQQEIYSLATAALARGQARFHVHIFPFRMTDENVARYADHEWASAWADLRPAYDSFERTRIPPVVGLCGTRYKVADGLPGETGGNGARLTVLKPPAATVTTAAMPGESGAWSPPACEFEDEARRRPLIASVAPSPAAASVTASVAGAALTTATEEAVAPPSVEEVPGSEDSRPVGSTAAARPVPASVPAPAPASRPSEVGTGRGGVRRSAATTRETPVSTMLGEGFGDAAFRSRERMTARGG